MFNSQGHVIFEQPLSGQGRSLVEMFMLEDIYSCFVRSNTVTIYRMFQQMGQFKLDLETINMPPEF